MTETPDKVVTADQGELPLVPDIARHRMEVLGAKTFYEKVLTTSDTSGSGRIVIPKVIYPPFFSFSKRGVGGGGGGAPFESPVIWCCTLKYMVVHFLLPMQGIAEANFPHIEQQMGINLPLIDVFGKKYSFRYRFWINNASRMYLVEGTQDLQRRFRLSVGDVLMFAKHPESNTYYVCGRKGCPGETSRRPPTKRPEGVTKSKRNKLSEGDGGKPSAVRTHPEINTQKKVDETKTVLKLVQKDGIAPKESVEVVGRVDDGARKAKKVKPTRPSSSLSQPTVGDSQHVIGMKKHFGLVNQQMHRKQDSNESWNPTSLPPRVDGVFRLVPSVSGLVSQSQVDGVMPQYGYWSAKATLGGEPFEAFFDTEQRAIAAYEAVRQS